MGLLVDFYPASVVVGTLGGTFVFRFIPMFSGYGLMV